MNRFASLATGAALATALVLSCSDDSPGDVDAAACDCPAAEPPVPSRMATVRGADSLVPADDDGVSSATCPANAKLLSGGCLPDLLATTGLVIWGFGKVDGQEAFYCRWRNDGTQPRTVYAEATCLVP